MKLSNAINCMQKPSKKSPIKLWSVEKMKQIAIFDNWSEHASLTAGGDGYAVEWIDKVHGREPYKKHFSSLSQAVRRYNDFMNTEYQRLNLDGSRKIRG